MAVQRVASMAVQRVASRVVLRVAQRVETWAAEMAAEMVETMAVVWVVKLANLHCKIFFLDRYLSLPRRKLHKFYLHRYSWKHRKHSSWLKDRHSPDSRRNS